ncbi:MAG: AAA family ATPase [Hyphomicrobiaceae bacterium]
MNTVLQHHFRDVLDGRQAFEFFGIENSIVNIADQHMKLAQFDLLIVDLGSQRDEAITAIDRLRKNGVRGAIVTVSDDLEQADVRALLHLRASDWLSMVDGRLPTKGEVIEASLKAVRENPNVRLSTSTAHCLSFISAAGGVGQSVLASTIGLMMAQRRNPKRTVCLIDLNFQYSKVTDYLDLEPRLDLKTIQNAPERLDRTLMEVMLSRHDSGLAVVASERRRGTEELPNTDVVLQLLNVVCEMFDDVIVDLPAMWQPWTIDILAGSNEINIVTDFSVPGIRQAKELLTSLPDLLAQEIKTKVIVNRYREKIFGGHLRQRDASDALGPALAGFVSEGGEKLNEAINLGQLESIANSSSRIAKELKRIIEGL